MADYFDDIILQQDPSTVDVSVGPFTEGSSANTGVDTSIGATGSDIVLDQSPTWTDLLNNVFGGTGTDTDTLSNLAKAFNAAKGLVSGTGPMGQAGAFASTVGIAALLNKLLGGNSGPQGYQGRIPLYTAERTQTEQPAYVPYAEYYNAAAGLPPPARRPGQGGINYFTPIKYTPTGVEPTTASGFLPSAAAPTKAPAAGADTVSGGEGGVLDIEPPRGNTFDGMAAGGIAALNKGRYIRGQGDGVSDSVPAMIHSAKGGRPAALADGEFVFPARIVAELGNGSNEAGARKLYAFLDRVEKMSRNAKRGRPSGADKALNKLA